jgi:predicted ABC-type sugar transport system permease subunit
MPGIYISRRKVAHKTVWEVFRAPVLVATITTAGLTFALFGNGLWDAISWLALVVPVLIAIFYWIKRRSVPGQESACGRGNMDYTKSRLTHGRTSHDP